MVVVEKSFHSIFNMPESRRKPAVLVIFLKIKYLLFCLSSKQSAAMAVLFLLHTSRCTQGSPEQVLPHSHPSTPLPRVESGTALAKGRPPRPSHVGDQGCGCTSPTPYV